MLALNKQLLKILFLLTSLIFLPRNANPVLATNILPITTQTQTSTPTWIGSKYQIECTMCSACDNPCNTPSQPPPSPPQTTTTYSPPPPSPPSSGTYNKYPPPYNGGSSGNGGGGGGTYYVPPPTGPYLTGPTPPNPIVPYFPYYYHSPPYAYSSSHFKKVPCFLIIVILVLCSVF